MVKHAEVHCSLYCFSLVPCLLHCTLCLSPRHQGLLHFIQRHLAHQTFLNAKLEVINNMEYKPHFKWIRFYQVKKIVRTFLRRMFWVRVYIQIALMCTFSFTFNVVMLNFKNNISNVTFLLFCLWRAYRQS